MIEFNRELVEKDLHEECSEEESSILNSNLELWRRHLVEIKKHVELNIQAKKVLAFESKEARTEFEMWKRGALFFKNKAESRLMDVSAWLKESRIVESKGEKQSIFPLLEQILTEVRAIAKRLDEE